MNENSSGGSRSAMNATNFNQEIGIYMYANIFDLKKLAPFLSIRIPVDLGSDFSFYYRQSNDAQAMAYHEPLKLVYANIDKHRSFWDGFITLYLDQSEHNEGTELEFLEGSPIWDSDNFKEYVIYTGRFEVKHRAEELGSVYLTYHKLMGVDTKECIRKILKNLKSQANGDCIYNTTPFPNYETFMKNKFMLRIYPMDLMDVEKVLTKFLALPTPEAHEFKSTISFCQMMTTTGIPRSITLVKDLTADLRRVVWNLASDIHETTPAAIDKLMEELSARCGILLPNGTYSPEDASNDNKLPSYEEAVED